MSTNNTSNNGTDSNGFVELKAPDTSGLPAGGRAALQTLLKAEDEANAKALVFLNGTSTIYRDSTDVNYRYRQESNFFYLTGVDEPDFQLSIDLGTGKVTLFAAVLDDDHAIWHGHMPTLEETKTRYGVDEVVWNTAENVAAVLESAGEGGRVLTTAKCVEVNQEAFDKVTAAGTSVDTEALGKAIVSCRLIKSEAEIECMRYANAVSAVAHKALMREVRGMKNEAELEALFTYHCMRHGLKEQAYGAICASGNNGAVLHYTDNNEPINSDDLVLIDAGCEYYHYASDVTRCFPANGEWTEKQKLIYNIVLKAHNACVEAMVPGTDYTDIHRLGQRIICEEMVEAGFLVGDVDELIEAQVPNAFFPHGLGHHIGLDVHDVGGYAEGVERIPEFGTAFLRARGVLKENMVLTIEPGLYFVDVLLDKMIKEDGEWSDKRKYLNVERIEEFRGFGGVRIEDDCVVTAQGGQTLTQVPKEIADIEAWVASA